MGGAWADAQTLNISQSQAARSKDPVQLALAGDTALKERRFDDALEDFSAASRLVPGDANLQFLTGYAAYMLGQFSTARAPLERALALNPKLTNASTTLGIVLYRLGKVTEAVRALEDGQKYAPDNKDITDLLAKWRPEARMQSGLYRARGAHFSVLFQGPSDDLVARRIVEMLEDAYWRIGGVLASYPPESIAVVLYTQEQFAPLPTRLTGRWRSTTGKSRFPPSAPCRIPTSSRARSLMNSSMRSSRNWRAAQHPSG